MKKSVRSGLIVCIILCLFQMSDVYACNKELSSSILSQFLFGELDQSRTKTADYQYLTSALYLCSEQCDGSGAEELKVVNRKPFSDISMEEINVSSEQLFETSHTLWTYESQQTAEAQKNRKDLLRDAVNRTFDFGFFNRLFHKTTAKSDSFAAILYYAHILCDYLQYDPSESFAVINGRAVRGYTGEKYTMISEEPDFTDADKSETESFYYDTPLDEYGRPGQVFARISYEDITSYGPREKISKIKPTGWKNTKYPDRITSEDLYNRSHLVAHSLAGKDNEQNLITGTRYMNEAMEEYESWIRHYMERHPKNHVLYRVTPIFRGDNLLASGIQVEAYSIEDQGKGLCFNYFFYNVQPGIEIDYKTGENYEREDVQDNETIVPFVTLDDRDPDLISEFRHYLEILLEDENESSEYQAMMQELDELHLEGRKLAESDAKKARRYIKTKEYEHQLFTILKTHLPKLLRHEPFFKPLLG